MEKAAKEFITKMNNRTPKEKEKDMEEHIDFLKSKINKVNLKLKKWSVLDDHGHCDFCQKKISADKKDENSVYADECMSYLVCKNCFDKHLR
jgi:hypothetical protein